MKINKEYPFPLPIEGNEDQFLETIRDVSDAVKNKEGVIKSYRNDALTHGASGVIVVEQNP